MSSSRHRGFTLIELMMSLGVAGLLGMIGAPALGKMLARSHERSAENALQASLMHAREAAVNLHVNVLVCPSADGHQCAPGDDWQHGWIIARDADRDRQADPGTPLLADFNPMPRGMRIVSSHGRPLIVFRPDGGAPGSNARLTICHVGEVRTGRAVVIANSGRVRIAAAKAERLEQCLAGPG